MSDQDNKTPEQLAADQAAADAAAAGGKKVKTKKARVLIDGQYGKCNAVVELEVGALKQGEAAGELDSDAAAVAYAESLAPKD